MTQGGDRKLVLEFIVIRVAVVSLFILCGVDYNILIGVKR